MHVRCRRDRSDWLVWTTKTTTHQEEDDEKRRVKHRHGIKVDGVEQEEGDFVALLVQRGADRACMFHQIRVCLRVVGGLPVTWSGFERGGGVYVVI